MKKWLLIILFCQCNIALISAQDYYSELRKKYWEYEENDERAFSYLNLCISSAKKEKNYAELYQAYKDAVRYSKDEKLAYADSAIVAAKQSEDNNLIGNAYTGKGIVYYFNYKKFQLALNEYLIADNYLKRGDDVFLQYQNLYHIGVVKSYLGYYADAIRIFKDCINYFGSNLNSEIHPNLVFNNRKGYYNSLHQLINCYQSSGNFAEAQRLTDTDFSKILVIDAFFLEKAYYYKVIGINDYYKASYTKAIQDFHLALPALININDFTWASVVYYYRGMSFEKLGNHAKAIEDFKKVDSIFNKHQFILSEVRGNYEELIKYSKSNNDAIKELYYTKQLLKADSIIARDFKYLSPRIVKEYDTKALIDAKAKLESTNNFGRYLLILAVIVILGLVFFFFYWFRHKKLLQLKYDQFLTQIEENNTKSLEKDSTTELVTNTNPKLDPKLTKNLAKKLTEFEKQDGFLEQGLTANKMSVMLDTNTTYLSQFLKEYKGCNFNTYVNRLRVQYASSKIYNNKEWRKYSIENIALACGFSNRQNFSKFFFEEYGIRPSDFLKKRIEALQSN